MPELPDEMYCSQQITVPPMFPYLLRQYAKAAIRTQPTDLLRWSTSYFRCLSLNAPPPVKPRLEYPISKEYDGITPGWLKTLLHQLNYIPDLDFSTLWDRWMGACLNHDTLIKILCLGGFDNPESIPFIKFIALCCGFISENLSNTMIMVCEILTEEPEGGSAMISVGTFNDLYTFLARIDASKPQTIVNVHFTDRALHLVEEKPVEVATPEKEETAPPSEKEPSIISETIEEEEKKEVIVEVKTTVDDEIVSCLDLTDMPDQLVIGNFLSDDTITNEHKSKSAKFRATHKQKAPTKPAPTKKIAQETKVVEKDQKEDQEEVQEEEKASDSDIKLFLDKEGIEISEDVETTKSEEGGEDEAQIKPEAQIQPEVITEYLKNLEVLGEGEAAICEPTIVEEGSLFPEYSSESIGEHPSQISETQFIFEEIEVEAIPGIGGVVPEELIEAVVNYMKKCANLQHGMVMPRNIRHYNCPPLENLNE